VNPGKFSEDIIMAKNTKELRENSVDELATQRRELKEEALNLRVQKESGQLENPARLRELRREVARIETLLSEKRHAAAQSE
jgi:large subunit ribosomal protein L29